MINKIPPMIDISQWRMRTYNLLMQSTARVFDLLERRSFRNSQVSPSALEKAEKYWFKESMVYTSDAFKQGGVTG